jgi:hypothetical protein
MRIIGDIMRLAPVIPVLVIENPSAFRAGIPPDVSAGKNTGEVDVAAIERLARAASSPR